MIRNFVQGEASTCGTTFTIPGIVPTVSTKTSCTVPKGNFVQLDGTVTNSPGPAWYAFDRVDPGLASYTDTNVPRFTPRFPTQRSSKRFLPNLYLASYGLGTQLEEIPPKAEVAGDVQMTFRFVARTRFSASADQTVPGFDASLAGTFGYQDMTLLYRSSESPLKILTTGNFVTKSSVAVTWSGGTGLTDQVELLIAINTMQQVDNYEYETVVKDLDWISMGVFPNNGAATATVPDINPGSNTVNFMIRSKDSNDSSPNLCYFFDLKPVQVQQQCTTNCACGDGTCDAALETCTTCPADCGTCPTPTSPPTDAPKDPCFSGETEVDVLGQGVTRMDALKIGDQVQSGDGSYSKLFSFGHRALETETKYLQIHASSMKKPLEISGEHLIISNAKLVPASQVKVGDFLSHVDDEGETSVVKVVSTRKVIRRGAYAPLTGSGDIVVNGVVASNYVSRDWVSEIVPGGMLHLLQHGAVLPYRLYCEVVGCENETYNETKGFNPWVSFWFGLEQWQLKLCPSLQFAFLWIVIAPVALLAVCVGKLLMGMTLANLIAALAGWYVWNHHSRKKSKKLKNDRKIAS